MAQADGGPVGPDEQDVLNRVLALNAERTALKAKGETAWLRLAYQAPRFGRSVFTAEDSGLAPNAVK